jgi:hypothetical protein
MGDRRNALNAAMYDYPPQETILNQLRRYISLDGGISGGMRNKEVALPTGNANIQSMDISGGGRAGVNIPINDLMLRLGVAGNFNKYRTEFDDKMQGAGAPDQVSGGGARLTGGDIGLEYPGGSVGLELNTPHPKEREWMLRFRKHF